MTNFSPFRFAEGFNSSYDGTRSELKNNPAHYDYSHGLFSCLFWLHDGLKLVGKNFALEDTVHVLIAVVSGLE